MGVKYIPPRKNWPIQFKPIKNSDLINWLKRFLKSAEQLFDTVMLGVLMKRYFLYVIVALMPLELMSEELGRFGKKDFKSPVREFGVIATKSGYFPESMFAYVGEKARFFITSTAILLSVSY